MKCACYCMYCKIENVYCKSELCMKCEKERILAEMRSQQEHFNFQICRN